MTIKPRFIHFVKLLFIILLTKVSYAGPVWYYGIDKAIQYYQEQVEENKGGKRKPLDSNRPTKFQTLFELCEEFKDLWPEISDLKTNRQGLAREKNVAFFNERIRPYGYLVEAPDTSEDNITIKNFVLNYSGLAQFFLSRTSDYFPTRFTFDNSGGTAADELCQHIKDDYSHQIDEMSENRLNRIIYLEKPYQETAKWQLPEKVKYVKQKFANTIDQLKKGLRDYTYNIIYSWNGVISHAGSQQDYLKQEFIYRLIYEFTKVTKNDDDEAKDDDDRNVLWLTEGLIEAYFIPTLKEKIIRAYRSQSSSDSCHQEVIKSVADDFQSCIPFYKRGNGYSYVSKIINDYQSQRQQNSARSSATTTQSSFHQAQLLYMP